MADSYIRQSTFADGDVISAEHGNKEFNQLVKAFHAINGHNHDGTQQGGASITDIADRDRTQTLGIRTTGVVGSVVDTDNTLAADDDGKLVSQKAIKAYIDSAASKAHVDSKAYTDQSIADVIIDEDDMVSDLDTKVPSQQSVKAYTDQAKAGAISQAALYTDQAKLDAVSQADLNRTNNLIDEDSMATNSATRPASQQSIVAYVNAQLSTATGNVTSGTVTNAEKLGNQLPSYYENIPERLGYTPIQQGGGNGQGTNKIYIGWGSSNALRLQVDGTDFGSTWPITSRDTQLLEGVSKATIVADAKANTVSTIAGVENRINVTPGQKMSVANEVHAAFSVYQPTPGSDAFVGFHVDGDYAAYFGIDGTTNKFVVGGWSMGSVKYAIYHEGNLPTALELNVVSQTQVSGSNVADTVVKRDAAGDVHCRLLRSEYGNQNTINGAMAFRMNSAENTFLRFCDDKAAIRAFLQVETFKHVGPVGLNIPDGYKNYDITLYNNVSTTTTLPPNPNLYDTVVIKKSRNIGTLTINASKNMYEDTNWNGGLSHNVTKACILSFIFDGSNWVLTVK